MTTTDKERMRLALAEENRRQRDGQMTLPMLVWYVIATAVMVVVLILLSI